MGSSYRKELEEMTSKQVSILIVVAIVGMVVLGIGLLAFSLSGMPVRQDSNSNTDSLQTLRGTITRIEPGKDGIQVELQTADLETRISHESS